MKIKVKYHNNNCKLESFGDWIDLKSAENLVFLSPRIVANEIVIDNSLISLGISMKLPKYFEANIVPRSSTFMKKGLIQWNHFGVIDNSYSGDNDIWKFGAIALKTTTVNEGERICQFRIQPSMQSPWYIKLKWLFTSKVEFVEVDNLDSKDRGGFGSSDK